MICQPTRNLSAAQLLGNLLLNNGLDNGSLDSIFVHSCSSNYLGTLLLIDSNHIVNHIDSNHIVNHIDKSKCFFRCNSANLPEIFQLLNYYIIFSSTMVQPYCEQNIFKLIFYCQDRLLSSAVDSSNHIVNKNI